MGDMPVLVCFAMWLTALSAGVIFNWRAQVRVNKSMLDLVKAIEAKVNQKGRAR